MDYSLNDKLIEEVKKLKFRFPVAKLTEDLGYNSGIISEYLNKKKVVSEKFLRKFSEVYKLEYDKIFLDPAERENSILQEPSDADEQYSIKEGKKKEVIALGKHVPLRLKPDQYSEAFGDWQGLPMYNTPVTASFVATYRDESIYQPQYYLHDPRFRDCDFGAIITGDSMHDEIRHGDFIACKEVKDTRFLVFGDIYYVVTTNGLETCKYVNADRGNPDVLLLVAKNEKISPSPLPKDMILRIYKVRGIVRGY